MIDSFDLYGRQESGEIVGQLLRIQWFRDRRRALYNSLAAYKRVIKSLEKEAKEGYRTDIQMEVHRNVSTFVLVFKSLMNFDKRDEARIDFLMREPVVMETALTNIFKLLG
jgi:hypothetical protein